MKSSSHTSKENAEVFLTTRIIDVLLAQMTDPVIDKIRENNMKLVRVLPNMTNLFQPLDRGKGLHETQV